MARAVAAPPRAMPSTPTAALIGASRHTSAPHEIQGSSPTRGGAPHRPTNKNRAIRCRESGAARARLEYYGSDMLLVEAWLGKIAGVAQRRRRRVADRAPDGVLAGAIFAAQRRRAVAATALMLGIRKLLRPGRAPAPPVTDARRRRQAWAAAQRLTASTSATAG